MDFVLNLTLFAMKTIFIAGSIIVVAILLVQINLGRARRSPQLEIEKLNDHFLAFREAMQSHVLEKKQFKKLLKDEKKQRKNDKTEKSGRVFVLDFHGDIRATQVERLREEITALLTILKPTDEIVVRLESGGGLVTSYGLASSQLCRIKNSGSKLTVCVDKIAASGGYMMACVAEKILSAPFAVVGSIGVIAQVPNFSKILKKHDIDYKEVTAGEFKRTVTVFGEITPQGLDKFKEQIEETHILFKSFVSLNRPNLNIQTVATGEHWFGTQAKSLGLIDEILTSDEYLSSKIKDFDVYRVEYHGRKKWLEKFSESVSTLTRRALTQTISEAEKQRYGV